MLPSHHPSQASCTPEQIAAWLASTQRKRLDLHLVFAEPWSPTLRTQAFLRMSDLVLESMEEVRVLSATLQTTSEALRTRATRLREQLAALWDCRARLQAQGIQGRPSAEDIHAAEQRILDLLQGDGNQAVP